MNIKHYNTSGVTSYGDKEIGVAKRKMSAEAAAAIAKKESQAEYVGGGFGCKCEKCGAAYSQSYLVYVYLGAFREGFVCRDCVKKYNLQRA